MHVKELVVHAMRTQAAHTGAIAAQGYLFRAAFLRRVPLFMRNLGENVALALLAAGLESTSRSWVSFLELTWRRALTARIHKK